MRVRKILVVDDAAPDRALYRRFLSRPAWPERFTVLEAATGAEALEIFRAETPDCVLLDYNLPDTDGLLLLAALHDLAPPETLCVLVITGSGNEAVAAAVLTHGALDYLMKQQFDAELLYRTVVSAIAKNESRQQLARTHAQIRAVNHELQTSLAELSAVRQELDQRNAQLTVANAEIEARNYVLSVSNEQLTHVNADLDSFVYTASHDLRAPIVNIEGLLAALLEELSDAGQQTEGIQHITQRMQGAVARFKKIIDDLAVVVKLEKTYEPNPERVELAALIRDVQLDLAPLIGATGARVEVELTACPTLAFSEKNLRSIVYNLLSNALKYHDPARAPHIRIRSARPDGHAVLVVQDNGLGINLAAGRPLFTIFSRFHSHVEGSGIGLYMVKKIIENAGGRVEVDSRVGEGSTFTVYFRQ